MRILTILSLMLFILGACKKEEYAMTSLDESLINLLQEKSLTGDIGFFELPESNDFKNIPQDIKNPVTADKVALGKMLFHETALAIHPNKEESKGTYSCGSCHNSNVGFHSGRMQGIADGGLGIGVAGESRFLNPNYNPEDIDAQPIRVPSNLNAMYQDVLLWNGQFGGLGLNIGTEDEWDKDEFTAINHLGFPGLETQAIAGIKFHRMGIDDEFIRSTGYKEMFDRAFPEIDEAERYTRINAGLAIAAFGRTLMANRAPFQYFLKGNLSAMTDKQKEGALLFFGKANCVNCHTGPALNSMSFNAIGMRDLDQQSGFFNTVPGNDLFLGRGSFTREIDDYYKFKVPQLYNLKDVQFFGHGSSLSSLHDVVRYKNEAVAENNRVPLHRLDENFVPLELSEEEIDAIVEFLAYGCYDPDLQRYVPLSVYSGNCIPNNDAVSRDHMGCN